MNQDAPENVTTLTDTTKKDVTSEKNISSRVAALRGKAETMPQQELEPMIKSLTQDCENMFHWDIWAFQQWSQRR